MCVFVVTSTAYRRRDAHAGPISMIIILGFSFNLNVNSDFKRHIFSSKMQMSIIAIAGDALRRKF